jgi:hypothetical protein
MPILVEDIIRPQLPTFNHKCKGGLDVVKRCKDAIFRWPRHISCKNKPKTSQLGIGTAFYLRGEERVQLTVGKSLPFTTKLKDSDHRSELQALPKKVQCAKLVCREPKPPDILKEKFKLFEVDFVRLIGNCSLYPAQKPIQDLRKLENEVKGCLHSILGKRLHQLRVRGIAVKEVMRVINTQPSTAITYEETACPPMPADTFCRREGHPPHEMLEEDANEQDQGLFQKQYLSFLRERHKNTDSATVSKPEVGNVVLIDDRKLIRAPQLHWRKGVAVKLCKGREGFVSPTVLRTSSKGRECTHAIKRATASLCLSVAAENTKVEQECATDDESSDSESGPSANSTSGSRPTTNGEHARQWREIKSKRRTELRAANRLR